jgi:4-aminobutyrate--pyruvate transaminase
MNLDSKTLHNRDIEHNIHFLTDLKRHQLIGPTVITRGEGIRVFDEKGNGYIDTVSGLWSAALGFDNERLAKAAYQQLRQLPFYHLFNHKSHPNVIELAERLKSIAPVPMSKVLFQCSGSEAIDTACKLIWYYYKSIGYPEKRKIIGRKGSYHGATVAAASLSGETQIHRDFNLPLYPFIHTSFPHFSREAEEHESEEQFSSRMAYELEQLILAENPDHCAAFFAEPVQISAGVIIPPDRYFKKIQKILRKYDLLFVVDEVATGFGRTGKMWGSEIYELNPDMLICAKALTASFMPVSALLVNEKIYQSMLAESEKSGIFSHGFTYGAHPVGTAVALETLKIFAEQKIIEHVQLISPIFQEYMKKLGEHPLVGEVTGLGLMGGLEIVRDKKSKDFFDPKLKVTRLIEERSFKQGLIVRGMGERIALAPPLITSEKELIEIFQRFTIALDETYSEISTPTA